MISLVGYYSHAQIDSTATLDVLRAPVSPAANLLGISNAQIEKPSDPTAFMATINQASSGFSALPTSFAIDIAPIWLFKGKDITMQQFLSGSSKYSIPQSFAISFATKSVDSLGNVVSDDAFTTKFSLGFKFSIKRGEVSAATKQKLMEMRRNRTILATMFTTAKDSILDADTEFKATKDAFMHRADSLDRLNISIQDDSIAAMLQAKLVQRTQEVMTQVQEQLPEAFEKARKDASELKFERYGFKLDLAGGLVWDFPKQNVDSAKYATSALWLTGGWDLKSGLSILFIARYQHNPDKVFADPESVLRSDNIDTFDGGARLLFSNSTSPFACSLEGIYRSVLNNNDVGSTWRLAINAEYDIGKNKKLTFIFGRDFDGTVTSDGNLIAALNLLLGFGSSKNLLK